MKDTSYRELPLGAEAYEYLRFKSKRLTDATFRDYESCLDKLARFYPTLTLEEFEPPAGIALVEEFMTARWGAREPRTYNKNLSVVHDFFLQQVKRGALVGDPTLTIERAKPRAIYHTTFTIEQTAAILAVAVDPRDHIALRLLLDYGIRKGALQQVRFEHFDVARQQLVIFTKGEKVHRIPIPDVFIWEQLELLLAEPGAQRQHFLLCKQKMVSRRGRATSLTVALDEQLSEATSRARRLKDEVVTADSALALDRLEEAAMLLERTRQTAERVVNRKPDHQMGDHGIHDWWYRHLERAGIVAKGVRHGQRIHKARHTAGQRLLDLTGNLKAVQMLLGHADIGTTAAHYTGWEIDQLRGDLVVAIAARVEQADRGSVAAVAR